MTKLVWDGVGSRLYEAGVDRGVLFIPDGSGAYTNGVAWNGLTTITEAPSGAAANPKFADNLKYLNLFSAEEFGATLQAFTYPDEFAAYDGLSTPTVGVHVAQQARTSFGLSYRTLIGNDVDGEDFGYKLHLVYGCTASPSQKAYNTINDQPAPIDFSWAITTVPVLVTGMRPTSLITINSAEVDPTALAAFETLLYGTTGVNPILPLPDAVVTAFLSGMTSVPTVTPPSYVNSTHVITIPATTGINYYINGVLHVAGAVTALTTGQSRIITAQPKPGFFFADGNIDEWRIDYASSDRAAN